MKRVEPKVFLVAQTVPDFGGIRSYLECIDADEWRTDARQLDFISEFMGRLCYRSFKPGLNANVKKVREGNDIYLENILESKHGNVLEHCSISFVFHNVSRVFTHELVRHRVGTAISQESLRYVRLTDLGLWLPAWANASPEIKKLFEETFETLGELQKSLAETLRLDDMPFSEKKKMTSFMRRAAPIGLATTIGWTTNLRNLRFVLQQRTSVHAEEEIRIVFQEVAHIVKSEAPNSFQDMIINNLGECVFENEKV